MCRWERPHWLYQHNGIFRTEVNCLTSAWPLFTVCINIIFSLKRQSWKKKRKWITYLYNLLLCIYLGCRSCSFWNACSFCNFTSNPAAFSSWNRLRTFQEISLPIIHWINLSEIVDGHRDIIRNCGNQFHFDRLISPCKLQILCNYTFLWKIYFLCRSSYNKLETVCRSVLLTTRPHVCCTKLLFSWRALFSGT
jgi:hypothetical protein